MYPSQRGLVRECPLSALTGTRLGIDANHYLRKLLSVRDPLEKCDTFTPAIGGAPLTLTAEVRAPSAPSLSRDTMTAVNDFRRGRDQS